jgi:hypothetical protein
VDGNLHTFVQGEEIINVKDQSKGESIDSNRTEEIQILTQFPSIKKKIRVHHFDDDGLDI